MPGASHFTFLDVEKQDYVPFPTASRVRKRVVGLTIFLLISDEKQSE